MSAAAPTQSLPQWLVENPKDGQLLVLVPGGRFKAGGPGSDEGGGVFDVELGGFYLGLYPVTNELYGRFVKEKGHRAPDNKVWEEGGKRDHPVTDVSWDDAKAYSAWAGLRLPKELEWEKGARYLDGREYPWGKEWNESLCRNDKNKGNETTSGVWGYGKGSSPWGPCQMSGNVWEWCEDWYEANAYDRYKKGDLKPPGSGTSRVVRGGSWLYDYPVVFRAAHRSYYGGPDDRDDSDGFRCVGEVASLAGGS